MIYNGFISQLKPGDWFKIIHPFKQREDVCIKICVEPENMMNKLYKYYCVDSEYKLLAFSKDINIRKLC